MNGVLQKLIDTGDIIARRSLMFYTDRGPTAYVTQYNMESNLGEFKWYITWKHPECNNKSDLELASIYINDARARLYFPAFLDARIPPANREQPQLDYLMNKYGLTEYDKFTFSVNTKGFSVIREGLVKEVEPLDCDLAVIHAIEEIWDEYNRTLG